MFNPNTNALSFEFLTSLMLTPIKINIVRVAINMIRMSIELNITQGQNEGSSKWLYNS